MANLAVHMRISSSPRSIGRMSRTIQRQTPSYNHDHWCRFLMLRRTGMVDVIRTTTTTTTTASPRSVLDHSTTTAAATAPPATAVNTFPIKKESQASQQPQQQQLSSSSLLSSQRGKFSSLNQDTSFQLVFLRHGQSTWNRDNRFIGWTDTPLTNDGVLEARVAGQMLYQSGLQFDEVHTSLLRRSIRTTNLVLMELGQEYIPVYKHWRLNERNYGSLTGQHKKQVVQQFGKDQVKRWRRSYDEPPPEMTDDHPYHPARDPRYRLVCTTLVVVVAVVHIIMRRRCLVDCSCVSLFLSVCAVCLCVWMCACLSVPVICLPCFLDCVWSREKTPFWQLLFWTQILSFLIYFYSFWCYYYYYYRCWMISPSRNRSRILWVVPVYIGTRFWFRPCDKTRPCW